ncbi:hypothetical protein WME95_23180 [Sorangium sp. So ce327]|uniref:hypothetical protein n=1 Tax=Sorangium sp. So ce327 TaxID=3133301 RepID=UPI003F635AF5
MNLRSARLAFAVSSALCLATSVASALDTVVPSGSILTTSASLKMMVIGNHLRLEVLAGNLLTTNAANLHELTQLPLASESFEEGPLHLALLDPHARDVMQVLVECALAPDESVVWTTTAAELSAVDAGATVSSPESDLSWAAPLGAKPSLAPVEVEWRGAAGLCPSWADGAPSLECQELVSACLLARNNARGAHVNLSLRWEPLLGEDSPGQLASSQAINLVQRTYPVQEGAFFGNLLDPAKLNPAAEVTLVKTFEKGLTLGTTKIVYRVERPSLADVKIVYQDAFACSPPDPLPGVVWNNQRLLMQSRICAMPGDHGWGCVAQPAGSCAGEPASNEPPPPVCDGATEIGSYPACNGGDATWMHPVTVFLNDPCQLYSCSGPPPWTEQGPYIYPPEDPFWFPAGGMLPYNRYGYPIDDVWNEPGVLDPRVLGELGAPDALGGQGPLPDP